MARRGWSELDVLLVSGDAYVDHPSFGASLVGRYLESLGLRVGIVAQPDWRSPDDLLRMGAPRLAVGVTAGNLDSMLNKLTAQRKVRGSDDYSPGGATGMRPNRASIVYANLCRRAFGRVPILLGGIEASLRRLAHYDYWGDEVRRSVLLDAKADLLVYGMAERPLAEILARLGAGEPIGSIRDVRGTAYVLRPGQWESLPSSHSVGEPGFVWLPSYEQVAADRAEFAEMTRRNELESSPFNGRPLLQPHDREAVVVNPPAMPLSSGELDAIYELPFVREEHPSAGAPVPALATVRFAVTATRGCFGGCAFCSLTEHQGRVVQSRSTQSVLREIERLARAEGFRGTITDVGGPTANAYGLGCSRPELQARCRRASCLHPQICRHLSTDHRALCELLRRARALPSVRHLYLSSGLRFDLAMRAQDFLRELVRWHVPGQLSVAPEHAAESVLAAMRKPTIAIYDRFVAAFARESLRAGREQFLVPYFVTGHPGATLADAVELACYLKRHRIRPRQVQDFIPTPMAVATTMYHTGLDPMSGRSLPVVRDLREKRLHKALALYWDPAHHHEVREALRRAGRTELIGTAPSCLVPPARRR